MARKDPPKPVHVRGTRRGERLVAEDGREPGRHMAGPAYRTARDSTGLNPEEMEPIDPSMPHIPPA